MKPPPFLTFAALALWGWQVGLLPWALVMGALVEAARWLRTRWDPGPEDFRRLWNVTTLILVGAGLSAFFAQGGWGTVTEIARDPASVATRTDSINTVSRAALTFVRWLPIVFFPFVLLHAGSQSEWLTWNVVSPYLSRRLRRQFDALSVPGRSRGFHPAYPYVVVALFAASAGKEHPGAFFPVLAGVVAWALWFHRTPRFGVTAWVAALVVGLGLAWAGQYGLSWTVERLRDLESQWMRQAGESFNPQATATDIGAVGRLKLSGRIVLRVQAEGPPPALLREAAYTHYRAPFWTTPRRDFQPVLPSAVPGSWRLSRPRMPQNTVTISRFTRHGETVVALPDGTFEVADLPADKLETNRLMSARAQGLPSLIEYTGHYGPTGGTDGLPGDDDLDLESLSPADREAIARAAAELTLPGLPPRQALEHVREFFHRGFDYSLDPPASRAAPGKSPLSGFLFDQRRGHCEYFATATTLLLRTAAIPTRYAVGYSVQEPSGRQFLVRARHAHAWCLAFVDGRWEVVDNTPAVWSASDARLAAWWEPIYDRLSGFWHTFSRWRQSDTPWRRYSLLAAIGVLAFMAYRELRGSRWRRVARAQRRHTANHEGDSPPSGPSLRVRRHALCGREQPVPDDALHELGHGRGWRVGIGRRAVLRPRPDIGAPTKRCPPLLGGPGNLPVPRCDLPRGACALE